VSNLIGAAPADVTIGMRVKVGWNRVQNDWLVPIFCPVA
jgi:uncharacterized OB-fold protein